MKPLIVPELPLNKRVLIQASAGTGKTYTIGSIVIRLLLEENLPIEKIVLITFTEAATAELKKKTAERIRKYALDNNEKLSIKAKANLFEAIAKIDEMPIFTIHGFCQRIISEFAFEIGVFEKIEVKTDTSEIKNTVIADFWRQNIKELNEAIELNIENLSNSVNVVLKHPHAIIAGENYEQSLAEYKNSNDKNRADAEKKLKYAIAYKLATEIRQRFADEKKKLKVMDFDDMIENCHKAIKGKNRETLRYAVKKRYEAILVDEFQDTDEMQSEIFDYLFENKPFFMIGDPKQAIYRFRGGDIFAYKKARETAGENKFEMNENFRSEKTLLAAVDVFFSSDSFKEKMGYGIPYTKVKCGKKENEPELEPIKEKDNKYPPFVIWQGQDEENKPAFEEKVRKAVISEIKRLLNTKKIKPKDIAILLDTNEDCRDYKKDLAKEGIFAIVNGGSVFLSDAANFLSVLLNAVCHNNNTRYIRALLTHNFCGFEPASMNDKFFIEWTSAIFETGVRWKKYGVMNAIEFFMTKQKLWGYIAANRDGGRHITNIRQLIGLLNEEEIKFGKIPEKINNRFASLCKEAASSLEDNAEERLETDEEALKIMTIHKSKGLEFNIVFMPDVSRQPHTRKPPNAYMYHKETQKHISFFLEDKEAKRNSDSEEREEISRLLYVAITRAKLRLYIAFSPCKKNKDGKISQAKGASSICREIFGDFSEHLKNLDAKENLIAIEMLNDIYENDYPYKSEADSDYEKRPKPLPENFTIEPAWQKTSFTGMQMHLETEGFSYSAQKQAIPEEQKIPAGKLIGTLLHSIFETLDFTADEKKIKAVVESKLGALDAFAHKKYGDGRKKEVIKWVKATLGKNLGKAGKLSEIGQNNIVTELSFFMKTEKINLKKIKEIMGNKIHNFDEREPEELMAKYVKGFIDLVFLGADGKYYILDWKSNNLDNYEEEMETAMRHHDYHLQYHIYAVALKRWLELTQMDFNFKEKFGGIYYIFIRGVEDGDSKNKGIYFVKPEDIIEDIEKMDKVFNGEC
jgi:exodeoxyribonuclease V beta subunit